MAAVAAAADDVATVVAVGTVVTVPTLRSWTARNSGICCVLDERGANGVRSAALRNCTPFNTSLFISNDCDAAGGATCFSLAAAPATGVTNRRRCGMGVAIPRGAEAIDGVKISSAWNGGAMGTPLSISSNMGGAIGIPSADGYSSIGGASGMPAKLSAPGSGLMGTSSRIGDDGNDDRDDAIDDDDEDDNDDCDGMNNHDDGLIGGAIGISSRIGDDDDEDEDAAAPGEWVIALGPRASDPICAVNSATYFITTSAISHRSHCVQSMIHT